MKISRLFSTIAIALAMACVMFAAPQLAVSSTFINFDIPAANGGGAIPTGINKWGTVVGYYGTSVGYDSFLWQTSGTITTIHVPGMDRNFAESINGSGWVVGYYQSRAGDLTHGFLRNPQYTTIDEPNAGTGSTQGTQAMSINDAGEIAGVYWDSNSVEHGFIRDASGNYTSFDVAGGSAVTSAILSQNGEIAGSYHLGSATYTVHGYLRDTLGNITDVDPADATGDTFVYGINASGEIAGQYTGSGGANAFVRDASGNTTTFTVPTMVLVSGIADNGNAYGVHQTAKHRGWKYSATGGITYFNDPSAGSQGTFPTCVSGNNKVAGFYYDSTGNVHSFEMHN